MYLDAGIQITPQMRESVLEIGKRFEFHREKFNKDDVAEFSDALDELYSLFAVTPIAKRIVHDGKSLISVKSINWHEQHQELWDLLVPSSGHANTVQAELIRISGKIANELAGNGGINWDENYKKMANTFLTLLKMGNSLAGSDLAAAEENTKAIKRKTGDTKMMYQLAVRWVLNNPVPITLPSINYNR